MKMMSILYLVVIYAVCTVVTSSMLITTSSKLITSYTLPEATENLDKISTSGNISVVGGVDYILIINHGNMNVTKIVMKSPTEQTCLAYGNKDCHNYVRVVEKWGSNDFFLCGTNARSEKCWTLDAQTHQLTVSPLTNIRQWLPTGRTELLATLMVQDPAGDELFTSSCVGSTCLSTRQINNYLKTYDSNTNWYNKAKFLATYSSNDNIYNFYRDERSYFVYDGFTSGGPPMSYGMVSRICRNDRGGGIRMTNNFMTFMSARLLCPYPGGPSDGRRSTYYNYLSATYKIGNTVYAIFTYPSSWGIPSTAICAFDLRTIDSHMEGTAFANNVTLYYDATSAAHTKTFTGSEALKPGQCPKGGQQTTTVSGPYQTFLQSSTIIGRAVLPITGKPLLILDEVDYKFMVGSRVGNYDVIKLYKADGSMRKIRFTASDLSGATKLAETKLNITLPMLSVTVADETTMVVTSQEVLRIMPGADCSSYKSCDQCEQDPDCDWLVGTTVHCGAASIVSVRVCPAAPPPPSDAVSNTSSTSIELTWSASSGDSYLVTIHKKSNGDQVYQHIVNTPPLVLNSSSLPQGQSYTASIQTIRSAILSNATTMDFNIDLPLPDISSVIQRNDDVTIAWNSVPHAESYSVDVFRGDATMPFLRYIIIEVTSQSPSLRVHGLEPSVVYRAAISTTSSAAVTSQPSVITFQVTVDPTTTHSTATTPVVMTTHPSTTTQAQTTVFDDVIVTSQSSMTTESKSMVTKHSGRVDIGGSSMEGTYISVIIVGMVVILIGIFLLAQNHLSIGVRTRVLRLDAKSYFLKRKLFFFWIRTEPSGKYKVSEHVSEEKLRGDSPGIRQTEESKFNNNEVIVE